MSAERGTDPVMLPALTPEQLRDMAANLLLAAEGDSASRAYLEQAAASLGVLADRVARAQAPPAPSEPER